MPLQVLPQQPQVSGYGLLGDALVQTTNTQIQRQRQDELIAQARANQLADVASARAEGDRTFNRSTAENERLYGRTRADQLTDLQSRRGYEDQVRYQGQQFQLEEREAAYDLQEAAKVADETRKLALMKPDKDNAQSFVDGAADRLSAVNNRIAAVSKRVLAQPEQVGPTDPRVLNQAQQLAGGSKNREEIAAMIPKALEQINGDLLIRHQLAARQAQEVLQSLKESERQLTDLIQSGMQMFRVVPRSLPPVPTGAEVMSDEAPPVRMIGARDLGNVLNQVIGAPQGSPTSAAPTSSPGALIDGPADNPVIAQGNRELQSRAAAQQQAALNQAIRDGEIIAQQLQDVQSAPRPTLGVGLGGMSVGQVTDPVAAGQATSDLLKKKAMNDAKVRQLQGAVLPSAAVGSTLPTFNTATSSSPRAPIFQTPDWMNPAGP